MKKFVSMLLVLTLLIVPSAAFAATGSTITGDMVNFRTGPGTDYARIGYLNRGDAVTVTGASGGWTQVTHNGKSGYVYSQYVSGGSSYANLRVGSRGSEVTALQQKLILLGYLSGSADGVFGAKTDAAVRQYQSKNGLTADGVAGKMAQAAVFAEAQRVETVVATAKKYLGLPYAYGGTSPSTGFDCSGFTQYCMNAAGISVPRTSGSQAQGGVTVSTSQMRVGDIVCFYSPVSHVGIYMGNGQFIHSPKTGDVVKITDLKYMPVTKVVRYTGR